MKDYHGNEVAIGDSIKSIETGWAGKVDSVETLNGDTFLVCYGFNWWLGGKGLDWDDKRWFAPADVIVTAVPEPAAANL